MSGEKAAPTAAAGTPAASAAPNVAAVAAAAETAKPGAAKPSAPGAAPAAGAKPVEQRPEEPPARSWAALDQQEQRQRREREADAKSREAWNKEKATAIEGASKSTLESIRKRIADGEIDAVASELGLDYKAWTTRRIAGLGKKPGAPGAASAAPQSAAEMEKAIADGVARELSKREEESKKTREVDEAKLWTEQWAGFTAYIKPKAEQYELLSAEVEQDPQHVESVLREMSRRGQMTYDQAAEAYEGYLVDKARKLMQLPKVKALLAPATKPDESDRPRAQPGQEQQTGDTPRTLTNAHAASSSGPETKRGNPNSKIARIAAQRDAEKEMYRRASRR